MSHFFGKKKETSKSEDAGEGDSLVGSSSQVESSPKEDKKKSKKDDDDEGTETFPVKKGDYQIQVHIVEARDLKSRDANGLADPVTVVEVMGKKQSTQIKKATLSCMWDQVLFFDFQIDGPAEFEAGKINISIFDANSVFKDVLIGSFELDVMYVWGLKKHEVYRKWVGLTDVTDEHEGIQGYVRASITIIGPGEEPPTHTEDEENDDTDAVLMPPNVEQEGHLLSVFIDRADELPKLDSFGPGIDAYVSVLFAGNPPVQTRVVSNRSPRWTEELRVPCMLPSMTDKIEISVWDYDKTDSDDVAATIFFKFSEIQKRPDFFDTPRWYNMYGCPANADDGLIGAKAKLAEMMNKGRVPGTAYRGRIMLSLKEKAEDEPKMSKKGEFLYNQEDKHAQAPPESQYLLRFQLYEASELPAKKDVTVKISVGRREFDTKPVKPKNGVVSWYDQPRLDDLVMSWPADTEQVPDVFINVMDGAKRMSYIRFKASEVREFNALPQWHGLVEDPHGCLDKGDFPGFMLFSLGFDKVELAPARKDLAKPPLKTYQLRTHIYQGRNLPAADEGGTSDPYCVVRCAGSRAQTAFKEKTRFPTWYQTLTMEVSLPQPVALAPDINILLYDHDQVGKDDLLGRITVDLETVGAEWPGDPKWLSLWMNDPKETEGELLVSFQLIPYDAVPPPTRQPIPSLLPEVKDCTVEITLLGLRNLKPYRLIKPQCPYVEFDLGDRSDKTKLLRSKRSKRPTGTDPNHAQILKLPAKIPVNPLFAPSVTVNVFDYRMMGVEKPLLGSAFIPLEQFMPWLPQPVVKKEKKGKILGEKKKEVKEKGKSVKNLWGSKSEKKIKPLKGEYEPLMDDAVAPIPEHETTAPYVPPNAAGVSTKEVELTDVSAAAKPEGSGVGAEGAQSGSGNGNGSGSAAPAGEGAAPAEEDDDDDDDTPKFLRGRWRFDDEIEDQLDKLPFDEFKIFRGNTHGAGLFDVLTGGDKMEEVGKVKGLIRIIDNSAPKDAPPFNIKEFTASKQYVLRLYILRGINLVPMDPGGTSDPYIKINVGGKPVVKDVEGRKDKTCNPEFRKCYELEVNIPGETQIQIDVMDHDLFSSDDLIGSTMIDLENLWFSDEWRAYKTKPVECRSLWSPSSSVPQGKLEMWVDLIPKPEIRKFPLIDIALPPPEDFSVRLIVWRARNMVCMDDLTNQNDLFVTATLEGMKREGGTVTLREDTDIHWRAKDGKGSFNYRLLYNVQLPLKNCRLKLQAWDKDLVGSSDAIGETTLNMQPYFKKALNLYLKGKTGLDGIVVWPDASKKKRNAAMKKAKDLLSKFLDPEYPEREWVQLSHPDKPGKMMGEVEVQLEIMHKSLAEKRPAGSGRDAPNQNPVLPPPDRIALNFARPDLMLLEMMGPELCAKATALIFCVFCGACCMFVGPQMLIFAATVYGNMQQS